ncbi:MAG: hypothetical protein QOH66_1398 [Actinomycetota bacterium]|nr:hypothetical protein [Actinomycetota bacterium]
MNPLTCRLPGRAGSDKEVMDRRGNDGEVRARRRPGSTGGDSPSGWQRKAEVGFGHVQGFRDKAAMEGDRVMAAVLPAREHHPQGRNVRELVAVEAGTHAHGAQELALRPASGGPCCCLDAKFSKCRAASRRPEPVVSPPWTTWRYERKWLLTLANVWPAPDGTVFEPI